MGTYVAEKKLFASAADGRTFEIHLAVGTPYAVSESEWACSVLLDGLHNKLRDQHGVDSWQALQLAYQLVAQLLAYFVQDGGQLFWEKGGESVSLATLIPKFPAF
jgi:hypothetical protein